MATLTNLRLSVGLELGLDYANTGDDQTLIDMRLNHAVRKVLLDTKCYVSSQSVTPGASADYTLGSDVLDIIDMYTTSGSSSYELERLHPQELLRLRRNGTSSLPTSWYALAGANKMMFHPIPSASDTFTMYYVPAPTALTSGSHDTSNATYGGIPDEYADLIELYTMHRLASFDDDASSGQGQRYLELYRARVGEARKELAHRGGHRLPRLTARRGLIRGTRSADVSPWF